MPSISTALTRLAAALAAVALGAAGCDSDDAEDVREPGGSRPFERLPRGSEAVKLDPADFTTRIDNPYWPMRPGTRWTYRETDEEGNEQRVEVTVTPRTKKIANGVEARVVHDVVSQRGRLVEDTYDWYAQDASGTIWYLGEDTREYERGKVATTKGSWEAGVDGAQAGVILPASPKVGMRYRQEYYAGEAEDAARILSLQGRADVPFGRFDDVLVTKDYTPLEPKAAERKYYARGVGPVLAVPASGGGGGREELLELRRGAG